MLLNHRKTREYRQIQILKDIGTRGLQSIASLTKIQQTNRTNIDSSIRVLLDIEYLEFSEFKTGPGSKEKFYKLTESGMEFLSKEQTLTLEEFWKTVFCVYDKQVFKTKFPMELFFSNYEKHKLGYDFEFTPVELGITLNNLSFYHPVTNSLPIGVSMLIVLSMDKPMTKSNIEKNLKDKNPLKIKITESKIGGYFQRLIQDNLIAELTNDKDPQYRLTVLGFLIIMRFLDSAQIDLHNNHNINTDLIIRKVIKNSQVKLPFISESWDMLKDIVDESNAVILFDNIIRKTPTISGTIHTDGLRELLSIERMMTEAFSETIKGEAKIGLNVISDLEKKGDIEGNFFSPVRKRLLFLLIISGFGLKDQGKIIESVKGSKFYLAEHAEKVISNKIAFEFFTYFIDEVIREKKTNTEYSLSKVQKWNDFQKSNKRFKEWFDNWVEHLLKFEESNIKVLSGRPFLNV